jgi:hypothetical protein
LRYRPEQYNDEGANALGYRRLVLPIEMDGEQMLAVHPDGTTNPLVWIMNVCYN